MNPEDFLNSLLAPQQMAQVKSPSPMMAGDSEMGGPKPQGQGGLLESVMKVVGSLVL